MFEWLYIEHLEITIERLKAKYNYAVWGDEDGEKK